MHLVPPLMLPQEKLTHRYTNMHKTRVTNALIIIIHSTGFLRAPEALLRQGCHLPDSLLALTRESLTFIIQTCISTSLITTPLCKSGISISSLFLEDEYVLLFCSPSVPNAFYIKKTLEDSNFTIN